MGNNEIRFGGPVKLTGEHLIHNDSCAEGSQFVGNGLYLGGRVNSETQGVKVLRLNGHAEWRSLQLDGEVGRGNWVIRGLAEVEDVFPD